MYRRTATVALVVAALLALGGCQACKSFAAGLARDLNEPSPEYRALELAPSPYASARRP